MKYKLYHMIQLTEGESATPLNLVAQSENLNDIFQLFKEYSVGEAIYCITENDRIIIDGSKWIYERDENKIYKRQFGKYFNKELICEL